MKVHKLAPYKGGILFTDITGRVVRYYNPETNSISIFAGNGANRHKEGLVEDSSFCLPCGIAVEFDSIVYVTDIDSNRVNMITSMSGTSEFLNAVGSLYDAFSIHTKGMKYDLQTLQEAYNLSKQCSDYLRRNETFVINTVKEKLPSSLDGRNGCVATKTVESVHMVVSGLKRLMKITETYNYSSINLLSCMTLDVEHFHSSTHIKADILSMEQYCRVFGTTLRESMKRLTQWAAHYFTAPSSWYPLPERSLELFKMPKIEKPPMVHMTREKICEMRDWASLHGRAIRQKS